MSPTSFDFYARVGCAWSREFRVYNASGAPQNLAGYSITFTITDPTGKVGPVELTNGPGGGITVTPTPGTLIVTLDSNSTILASRGRYWWLLTIVDPQETRWNLAPDPPLRGTLTVSP